MKDSLLATKNSFHDSSSLIPVEQRESCKVLFGLYNHRNIEKE